MVDGIEIREESDSVAGETLSIKDIILRQIRKISDISCKEFTGGYWEKKPVKTGSGVMFMEKYHNDVREAYCNAVDFLIDIIFPLGDKALQEYLAKFEDFRTKIIRFKKDGKKWESKETIEAANLEIKEKLKLKRQTFRQINIMFERNNFWKGTSSYNE